MEEECIFIVRPRPKSDKDGSYAYIEEGRAGNPRKRGTGSIHPVSFLNSKGLHFPVGFTLRLQGGDKSAFQELRRKAFSEASWKDGYKIKYGDVFQVRRNYGGNQGHSNMRRLMYSSAKIDTSRFGTKIIIRKFEV